MVIFRRYLLIVVNYYVIFQDRPAHSIHVYIQRSPYNSLRGNWKIYDLSLPIISTRPQLSTTNSKVFT